MVHVSPDENKLARGLSLIVTGQHDARSAGSLTCSILVKIGDILGIDPMETDLELRKRVDTDWLNRLPSRDVNHKTGAVRISFWYRDLKVFACECGEFYIYGDEEEIDQ